VPGPAIRSTPGALVLALAVVAGCTSPTAPPPAAAPASAAPQVAPRAEPPPQVVAAPPAPVDWDALRVAETACADCHPDQVASWVASPMARSFRPVAALPPAIFAQAGEARHATNQQIFTQAAGVFAVQPGDPAQAGLKVERTVTHAFGSGAHVHTFAWAAGDRLFQLPMSWYVSKAGWDLSPGYAELPEPPGLFREVTSECLNCHTDPVPSAPDDHAHLLALPAGGFGCSRCHGDGRAHVAGRQAGRAEPIVRPDQLPPSRAADVCAMCHFAGPSRILRPGRTWGDFLPGRDLADVVAVFVRQQPDEGFRATDHVARLALSACARGTPTLTCTTCHTIHTAPADRSAACRSCHQASPMGAVPHDGSIRIDSGIAAKQAPAHACAGPAEPDCVHCHMDSGPTSNIPHTTGTDHFIRKRPVAQVPRTNDSPLVWAARPDPEPTEPQAQLLLGRAYVEAWRSDHQAADATRAARLLEKGLAAVPGDADAWLELATLGRLQGDVALEKRASEQAFAAAPTLRRAAVLVGAARLAHNDPVGGLAALDQAASAQSSEVETLRARALMMVGRLDEARAAAQRATELRPADPEAWLATGLLASQAGVLDQAAQALAVAAAWAPGDLRAWLNLGWTEARRAAWPASGAAFEAAERNAGVDARGAELARVGRAEALLHQGELAAARQVAEGLVTQGSRAPTLPSLMGRILLAAGDIGGALAPLETAVQINPDDREAWGALAEVNRKLGRVPEAEASARRAAGLP